MSDQSKLGLGRIITTEQNRDAIHIAVAPVIAAHTLISGRHVGIDQHGQATEHTGSQIGIVDPFLRVTVEKGQTFWLFLYPGTITSLRHEWAHPAFGAEEKVIVETSTSEKWMRAWSVQHMGKDYYGDREKLTEEEAYGNAITAGHTLNVGPYEDSRDHIDSTWWSHWSIITGEVKPEDAYFSCSC